MPVRKATPEETKALFGKGLIVFGPGLRPPPGWKPTKKPAELSLPEPSAAPAESAADKKTE